MKNQDAIFYSKEADVWFARNKEALTPEARRNNRDLIEELILEHRVHPKRVLDVGTGNGWRIEAMRRKRPRATYIGIEPSLAAIAAGKKQFPKIELKRGVASNLPFKDASCDLVLVVFTFHWMARENLLQSVAEIDRVLKDGGHLIVSDFLPHTPRKNPYRHRPGVFTWKADYGALFEASGNYTKVKRLYTYAAGLPKGSSAHERDDYRAASTLYKKKVGAGYVREV